MAKSGVVVKGTVAGQYKWGQATFSPVDVAAELGAMSAPAPFYLFPVTQWECVTGINTELSLLSALDEILPDLSSMCNVDV